MRKLPVFALCVLFGATAGRAQDAAAPASANAAAAAPTASAPASPVPTLFILGDSTARNTGRGAAGWGTPIADYFDPAKIKVSNDAHAGTSSRTYYNNAGDWPRVLGNAKAGDYALVVFGINDGGPPQRVQDRGSIPGTSDETVALARPDGTTETAHTYGWYMKTFANELRAKGVHVYFLTVTARNIWSNPKARFNDAAITSQQEGYNSAEDKIERGTANGRYTQWTKDVGAEIHVPVLDLTNLEADRLEKMGREAVMVNYLDHNHTNPAGADIVASTVVSGLKAFKNSPFIPMLSEKGQAVAAADVKYVAENPSDGKATGGSAPAAATGATSAALIGQGLNALPANPSLPTLWIIGDSTVRNGAGNGTNMNQWGWGAPIEYYFDLSKLNVVNRALGGTSSRTFYNSNWPRIAGEIKRGDFVILQFGHNDNNGNLTNAQAYRASLNGAGDETQSTTNRGGQPETVHTFGWYLKQFVAETRAKGATPIICSLIPRKIWADGKIVRVNENYFDYTAWAAQVAKAENVPFINLNEITARKYDALGQEKVEPLFVPAPAEHTHTDWYGAVINAESVIGGLKALKDDPLANYFSPRGAAVPAAAVP